MKRSASSELCAAIKAPAATVSLKRLPNRRYRETDFRRQPRAREHHWDLASAAEPHQVRPKLRLQDDRHERPDSVEKAPDRTRRVVRQEAYVDGVAEKRPGPRPPRGSRGGENDGSARMPNMERTHQFRRGGDFPHGHGMEPQGGLRHAPSPAEALGRMFPVSAIAQASSQQNGAERDRGRQDRSRRLYTARIMRRPPNAPRIPPARDARPVPKIDLSAERPRS